MVSALRMSPTPMNRNRDVIVVPAPSFAAFFLMWFCRAAASASEIRDLAVVLPTRNVDMHLSKSLRRALLMAVFRGESGEDEGWEAGT